MSGGRLVERTNSFVWVLAVVALVALAADLAMLVDAVFWLVILAVVLVLIARPLARRARR